MTDPGRSTKKMQRDKYFKAILVGVPALALLIPIVLLLMWRLDAAKNRGLPFGYWAQFNRVADALNSSASATVESSFANRDIVIEEFGFFVKREDGATVKLLVEENDLIRSLKGAELERELLGRLNRVGSEATR